jgi:hypothetical protein
LKQACGERFFTTSAYFPLPFGEVEEMWLRSPRESPIAFSPRANGEGYSPAVRQICQTLTLALPRPRKPRRPAEPGRLFLSPQDHATMSSVSPSSQALSPALIEAAGVSKAWPFEEARKIIKRYETKGFPERVLFETGYGPSGLPHIGTFGEVARTTMVRHAFHVLTDNKVATDLLCFSDDMDGMRKIPDNVPDRAFLEPHLHKPLTAVPNPFGGDYESFGHHNNAMLRRFLDTFGFDYTFASATE